MAGHALRGMVSAGLALIVVETLARTGGGRVGSLFTDVNRLVQRALSPDVALIPDRRSGLSAGDTPAPYLNGITPNELRRGAQNAPILASPGFQAGLQNGIGHLTQADITRLQNQLGGLAGYTPDQLARAYGLSR